MYDARIALVRIVQAEEFQNKIKLLKCKENVPKRSRLINLNLCLDNYKVLRVGRKLAIAGRNQTSNHIVLFMLPSWL